MLIVFDGSLDGLNAESERCFHFYDKFFIDRPGDVVVIVVVVLGGVEAVPRVLLQSFDVDALAWVRHKNLREDVFRVGREELGQGILRVHDFLVEVGSLLIFKGQVAAKHRIQDDSAGPNVRP